jgi:DNA-binding CsgD family transcriptional regulator
VSIIEHWLPPAPDGDVRVVAGAERVAAAAEALCATAAKHIRLAGAWRSPVPARQSVDLRCRILCPPGPRVATGRAELRFHSGLPVELVHVDDTVALVVFAPGRALLARSGSLVAMTGEWFDRMWETTPNQASISDRQRRVLALMAVADDHGIARRLEISVTTVRRHIKSIYEMLGVDNRFAAGVLAAKHGWL